MIEYTGTEYTKDPAVNKKLEELRTLRDDHSRKAEDIQREIDQLIVESKTPFKICAGDYVYFRGDECPSENCFTVGMIEDIHRTYTGVRLDLRPCLKTWWSEESPSFFARLTDRGELSLDNHSLSRLKKTSRAEYCSCVEKAASSLASMAERTFDPDQLTLELEQ